MSCSDPPSEAFDTKVRELASLCARLLPGRNHTSRAAVTDVSMSTCRRHQLGLVLDCRTGMSEFWCCKPVPPTGAEGYESLPDSWADSQAFRALATTVTARAGCPAQLAHRK